jgi:hypothetical protein
MDAAPSMSVPTATSVATRSGRRAAAYAPTVPPSENPATYVFPPNRSRRNSRSDTVSAAIRSTLIAARSWRPRSKRPQPRWS